MFRGGNQILSTAASGRWKKGKAMARDTRRHDWNKEQPHHVDTGRITKEDYARSHPNKVEWVKEK
jgi:hypothetical protein